MIVDYDGTEKKALWVTLPRVSIQLCTFYVIGAWSKGTKPMSTYIEMELFICQK